ncbi:MAG: pentapeptide repeat-containing protein [Piscirickettsiaceae bacterium]|nr:pentapeptide repeat-containing protein [Piscirickettsiaceae bacterium]
MTLTKRRSLVDLDEKDEYWSENFKNLDFSGQEISSKEFDGCTFEKCNFSEATFKRCNFVDCEFINCNLSIVKMEYSTFSDVCFKDSKLIGINWTQAAWPGLIFTSPIKFYKSILNESSFYGLSLQDLVLEECKAHNVDFREGDFSNSNFTHTELSGSIFANTNLSGADFSEATDYDIDIYQNILKKAKFSRFEAIRLLDSLEIELVD